MQVTYIKKSVSKFRGTDAITQCQRQPAGELFHTVATIIAFLAVAFVTVAH